LLPERAAAARARLPTAVRVLPGDALALPLLRTHRLAWIAKPDA
jgi:hypothetical protein